MASFRDKAGRDWRLEIDVAALARVHAATGVDIGRLFEDGMRPYQELARDWATLVRVLWVLVADEAARTGVTEEQFGRGIGGDVLDAAERAFFGAVTDFYPSRQGKLLKTLMSKALAAAERTMDRAMEAAEALDPEALSGPPTPSATTSPGSSASIPAG
jgi:hypothetical protein